MIQLNSQQSSVELLLKHFVFRVTDAGAYEYEIFEKKTGGVDTGYYVKKEDFYTGDGRNFANAELNTFPHVGPPSSIQIRRSHEALN